MTFASRALRALTQLLCIGLVVLAAGLFLSLVALFLPRAGTLVGWLMGIVVPIGIYYVVDRGDWLGNLTAFGGTVISGILAGWLHTAACKLLVSAQALETLSQRYQDNCSPNALSTTYFTGWFVPLFPAAMMCLIFWYISRPPRL